MDVAYAIHALLGLLGLFLLGLTYTYIDKLEKTGCACAEHKYKNFIKKFAVFAFVFLIVSIVFPPAQAVKMFGEAFGTVYAIVEMLFSIALFVFFVLTLIYVRYLMREKCKCSEDIRREILYIWSLLEIILVSLLFVVGILKVLVFGSFAVAMNTVAEANHKSGIVREAALNPVGSAIKVGKSVKKTLKKASKM